MCVNVFMNNMLHVYPLLYLLVTYSESDMLCCMVAAKAEHGHWESVPVVAVAAAVSNGTQLVDEHHRSHTEHSHLPLLSVRFYWFVSVSAFAGLIR